MSATARAELVTNEMTFLNICSFSIIKLRNGQVFAVRKHTPFIVRFHIIQFTVSISYIDMFSCAYNTSESTDECA